MNNKFDALKDDDSGDHDQNEENNTQKDGEKEKNDREKPQSSTKRKAVVPGPAEHPLQYNYTFWYSRRTPGRPTSSQSYEQNIKQIGTFASVEQFWRFYSHMVRPGDLTGHSDFHLFKEGIKPMWEDDANKNGGKWIIRLRKGLASRCWENLILAMLGEQFMVGEEICGAVVSVRFQEDIISIWNKTASDQATTARIRDTLRRVLNLPPNTIMEYKTHTDSIKYVWWGTGRACCWWHRGLNLFTKIAMIWRTAWVHWGCSVRTAAVVASALGKPNMCVIIKLLLGIFGSNGKGLISEWCSPGLC
uniref:Eukaryotic translation initiation factor 4E type 2 n=1 Tax=Nothoprocta perdicaria TaxID=30464 RepID=A0A8C6Z2Q0_NOTPE